MRILVLSNARSGTSGRRSRLEELSERLRRDGAEIDRLTPGSADEMRHAAAEARRSRHDVLVAAGGDGTLNAIANGLLRTARGERPPLAILPTGRGNDFAAELGLRTASDTYAAIEGNDRRLVDLGRSDAGYFLGVGGTGFDAQVARRAQGTPLLSGSLLYSYAVVRTLLDFHHVEARIAFDQGTYEGPLTFAAVGNARRYGGGMQIAPRAELSDGLLDLCLVSDVSRATLLYMFPTVFSGEHLSHESVTYRQTRFVEIETREPAELFADGEFFQETPVRIDVVPGELEVLTRRR